MKRAMLLLSLAGVGTPALAQIGSGGEEIIVTASRREADGYDEAVPAVGLRRVADFAVQEVTISGDTRDEQKRRDEVFAMVRSAIELASKRGLQLATGEQVVEPLTLANYRSLPLIRDSRPDTNKVSFLVKAPLSPESDAKAALDRIAAYVKAVPAAGRAEMREEGDLTLSVVGPDQYRARIIEVVAADARATAAKLGADYAVEVKGLDRPVEWSRASLTEVLLYVPYSYTVVPR
jgi:hypothetical protein